MADEVFSFTSCKTIFCTCIEDRESDPATKTIENAFYSLPHGSDLDKKACCDQAFKECLLNLVLSSNDDNNLGHGISLVKFAISCAKNNLCTSSTPVLLLADIFETLTIDRCGDLFNFVEESVPMWTSETFFTPCKNHLLRMCNDILRRLSKSQNTIFCGRIQLFLARLFPLEEKSALNLMSHFNTENVTIFKRQTNDNGVSDGGTGNDNMETEEGELPSANPVDFDLYTKLWSLQEFFSNPAKCYTAIGWRNLKVNTAQVLKTFSSYKLEYVQRRKKGPAHQESITFADILKGQESARQYFPKFLTNENLMNLQLNDGNFRRHLLVQYLILFQHLTRNTKQNQALNDQQQQWVTDTKTKVTNLLTEVPPDGEKFTKAVLHILEREENWINWKNDGCPSFAKTQDEVAMKRTRKRSIGDDLALERSKRLDLGSSELTRLWNICPDNLEACKAESRTKFLPTLQDFFEEAIEQANPDAGIEEEYKLVKKSEFGWRALRLLSRRSFNFFTPSNQPFKPLSDYLTHAVGQVARDLSSNQGPKDTEEGAAISDKIAEN